MNNCCNDSIFDYWSICQSIDTSNFATKKYVDDAIEGISGGCDCEEAIEAISGAVSAHIENNDIHVTSQEKEAWNAKLDASDISGITAQIQALQDAVISLGDRVSILEGIVPQKANSSALTEIWDAIEECCSGSPVPPTPPTPTPDTGDTSGYKAVITYSNSDVLNVDYQSLSDDEILSKLETQPTGYTASLMTSAVIGNRVYSLGAFAFERCSSLTSVTIPEGVEHMNAEVFVECTSLSSITLPSTIQDIGSGCFTGCTALESVTILATTPPSVTNVADMFADALIYVPSASLNAYKSSWNSIAERIFAIN